METNKISPLQNKQTKETRKEEIIYQIYAHYTKDTKKPKNIYLNILNTVYIPIESSVSTTSEHIVIKIPFPITIIMMKNLHHWMENINIPTMTISQIIQAYKVSYEMATHLHEAIIQQQHIGWDQAYMGGFQKIGIYSYNKLD